MSKSVIISLANPYVDGVESNSLTTECYGTGALVAEGVANFIPPVGYGNISLPERVIAAEVYQTQFIHFKERFYYLYNLLVCTVTKEDGSYIFTCELLDITVWGGSFEEAVEAFNFAFDSAYRAYALEDDTFLTDKAKDLKKRLLELVSFSM